MNRRIPIAAAFLALAGGAAPAGQPFSDSMADCAGLMQATAEFAESDDLFRRLDLVASRFESAAYVQAQKEGRATPQAVIGARIEDTRRGWSERGRMMVFSEDFRDWTAYCRSFARRTGIDLDP